MSESLLLKLGNLHCVNANLVVIVEPLGFFIFVCSLPLTSFVLLNIPWRTWKEDRRWAWCQWLCLMSEGQVSGIPLGSLEFMVIGLGLKGRWVRPRGPCMSVSFASYLCRAPWLLWKELGLWSPVDLVQDATPVVSSCVASGNWFNHLHLRFLVCRMDDGVCFAGW